MPALSFLPTVPEFVPSVAILRHMEHCAIESSARKTTSAIMHRTAIKYVHLNFTNQI